MAARKKSVKAKKKIKTATTRKPAKKTGKPKAANGAKCEKTLVKPKRSKPARNMGERVRRKWLYQCAYWRVCESCTMREHCAKMVKDLGVEKSWLTEQILGPETQETEPIKVKTNNRFLSEKEWLNQTN